MKLEFFELSLCFICTYIFTKAQPYLTRGSTEKESSVTSHPTSLEKFKLKDISSPTKNHSLMLL